MYADATSAALGVCKTKSSMATPIKHTPLLCGGDRHLRRSCAFRLINLNCRSKAYVSLPSTPFCPRALKKRESQERSTVATADECSFSLLAAVTTLYNDIVVLDSPKARFLLLDASQNIHSALYKDQKWTGSYWDEFASLPAIVPQGPIAIFGLGAGTAANLLLDLWPSFNIEGWEIDQILVDIAREHFGLSDLERGTKAGGTLSIHIGDALSSASVIDGGFAGCNVGGNEEETDA